MDLVASSTELTTAATDAVLAAMAIAVVFYLYRIGKSDRFRAALWMWVFGLMGAAAGIGAIVHGLRIAPAARAFLWHPVYLFLGLLVALFIVAAVYDLRGEARAKRVLSIMVAVGFGFWGITLVRPGSFFVFIVYEAAAMVFALGGYVWLFWRGRLSGAGWMAGGILITIIAAGVQAGGKASFTFIWPFDHNGIYHLIQMAGMLLIVGGLRRSFNGS